MDVTKEWLAGIVNKFTFKGKPLQLELVLSLADKFETSLSALGIAEAGKTIQEFEIYHESFGWIKCDCKGN